MNDLLEIYYADIEEIINTRLGQIIGDEKWSVAKSEHRLAKKEALDEAKTHLLNFDIDSRQSNLLVNKIWRDINER